MRLRFRVWAVLALSFLLLPAGFASGPAAPKTKSKKAEADTSKKAARAKPAPAAEKGGPPAGRVASAKAASPAQGSRSARAGAAAEGEVPTWKPVPATTGTLGLFTVETGNTLPKKGVSISTYVNKFSREPGDITVLNLGWSLGVGLQDRVTLFVGFEPHRHIHVGRPGLLSFNSPLSNPQFDATIYRQLSPTAGSRPAYVEDFPFAGNNTGGFGEVTLGLKFGLWSELRGDPVSFSVRNDFIFPTRTTLSDLLDEQVQSGQFNYGLSLALSKTWSDIVTTSLNWGYRFTRDPRSGSQQLMTQADQFRAGAGLLLFPKSRVQFMTEYTGLVFAGDSTPNTTFGPRDPVDGVWGVRLYPWDNVALDLGYRYMLNLTGHGDRNGFVIKLGTVYWPEKPKPVNRPPVAACSADKSSVYAESGELVRVALQASDPDGDQLSYSWTASGGRVDGTGTEVRWNSAGTAPGTYAVTVRVDDGRGGTAGCAVDIRVEPRPNRPPEMSCSADRTSVLVGERVRITAVASDPDGDPLSYAWRTNGGQILGLGSAVQLDTTDLAPGRYTVTGRVDDGRGGAADCSVGIDVHAPPPPPQASKLNECFFRHVGSARVDNVCKRVLDDVALRLQNDPKAKVVLVGCADPKERKPDKLAGQRAANAKKYVASRGIAESRIDVRGATGQVGAGKQNRRIDIIWVPEGATY